MCSPGTGGLLQSPVPTHGHVNWTATTTMSTPTTTIESMAFLLVASGIKILNYSDAVARVDALVVNFYCLKQKKTPRERGLLL